MPIGHKTATELRDRLLTWAKDKGVKERDLVDLLRSLVQVDSNQSFRVSILKLCQMLENYRG